MSGDLFLVILAAAAMHASWNAIVKIGLDRFMSICLVATFAGLVALLAVPFVPFPRPESLPWLAASVVLHIGYNIFLSRAYQAGDMGLVYPIARGSAPLLTAVFGVLVAGEHLSTLAVVGIAVLSAGICLISARDLLQARAKAMAAVVPALITAGFIAAYSVSDGLGGRASGSAHGYAVWLFVLDGVVMLALVLWWRGPTAARAALRHWPAGLAGGTLSLGAYWIVIWAMTQAPIALVAALRETSVLFAAVIAVVMLGEPARGSRWIAAGLIACGMAVLKLS